jgi:hypothetical protein
MPDSSTTTTIETFRTSPFQAVSPAIWSAESTVYR